MVQHQQLVHYLQRLSPAPLPHLSRHTPSLRLTPPLLPHKHTQSIEQRCRRMIVLRNYLTPLLHVYSPGRSTTCSSPRRPPRTPTRFLSHRSPILTPRRTEPSAPSTLASPARDPAQTRAIPRSVPSPRPVRARSPDSRSESICRVRTLPTVINVSWRETAPDALLKYVHHVRPPIGDIRVKPRQREEKPAVAVAIVVAAADSLRFTTLAEIPPLSAAENRAIFPEERRRKKRPNSRADADRDSVPAFATRRRSPA